MKRCNPQEIHPLPGEKGFQRLLRSVLPVYKVWFVRMSDIKQLVGLEPL